MSLEKSKVSSVAPGRVMTPLCLGELPLQRRLPEERTMQLAASSRKQQQRQREWSLPGGERHVGGIRIINKLM